jgi:hypothetical protein
MEVESLGLSGVSGDIYSKNIVQSTVNHFGARYAAPTRADENGGT